LYCTRNQTKTQTHPTIKNRTDHPNDSISFPRMPSPVHTGTTKYFDHRYPIRFTTSPETVVEDPYASSVPLSFTSSRPSQKLGTKKKYKKHGGHGAAAPALPSCSEHEYRIVKNFPTLASDSLSISQRRTTRRRRVPHFGSGASVSTVRSMRSQMSELTKSPFESNEDIVKGPLTEIRRNMMVKVSRTPDKPHQ
jgi:hypothetical protein